MNTRFDAQFTIGRRVNRDRRLNSNRYRSFSGVSLPDSNFKCKHCHNYVSVEPFISGVKNRNHCPYCLWSKHIDLHKAGDRLAACKEKMKPVGLTLKKTRKKYGDSMDGELMLIHQCAECGAVSINRIAADDDPEAIFEIFNDSFEPEGHLAAQLTENDIQALTAGDADIVRARLFGWEVHHLA